MPTTPNSQGRSPRQRTMPSSASGAEVPTRNFRFAPLAHLRMPIGRSQPTNSDCDLVLSRALDLQAPTRLNAQSALPSPFARAPLAVIAAKITEVKADSSHPVLHPRAAPRRIICDAYCLMQTREKAPSAPTEENPRQPCTIQDLGGGLVLYLEEYPLN